MIKINKDLADIPDKLKDDKLPFRDTYHRDISVKQKLSIIQYSKCAFCEKLLSDNEIDIDHFIPSSLFRKRKKSRGNKYEPDWDHASQWRNLLLTCEYCNRICKNEVPPFDGIPSDFYFSDEMAVGARLIIDPSDSSIDPEQHISFELDGELDTYSILIIPKAENHSELGVSTIELLKLGKKKHGELLRAHILTIERAIGSLKLLKDTGIDLNHFSYTTAIDNLRSMIKPNAPYSVFTKKYILFRCEKVGISPRDIFGD